MELLRDIAAWVLILGGSFFFIVGSVGLVRLPDVYSRVHSAGTVDTVGAGLFLIGLMFYGGFTIVSVKLLLIIAFVFFTSPVSTNALGNAMHASGVRPLLAEEEDASSKRS